MATRAAVPLRPGLAPLQLKCTANDGNALQRRGAAPCKLGRERQAYHRACDLCNNDSFGTSVQTTIQVRGRARQVVDSACVVLGVWHMLHGGRQADASVAFRRWPG